MSRRSDILFLRIKAVIYYIVDQDIRLKMYTVAEVHLLICYRSLSLITVSPITAGSGACPRKTSAR